MNYFDDYYNDSQPQQEEPQYSPPEPKKRKERKGLRRFVSAVLILALVIGSCGATAFFMNQHWEREMKNLTQQMNDKIAAAQNAAPQQSAAVSGRPLASGEYLTPGEVYERNVNAVVAVTVQVEATDNYGRVSTGLASGTGFFISADGYVLVEICQDVMVLHICSMLCHQFRIEVVQQLFQLWLMMIFILKSLQMVYTYLMRR